MSLSRHQVPRAVPLLVAAGVLAAAGAAAGTADAAERPSPGAGGAADAAADLRAGPVGDGCAAVVPARPADPAVVRMSSSGRAPGASGTVRIRLASSPTGLALTGDGSYRHEVRVEAEGLRGGPGVHHVAWAATPELDRHLRIGPLGEDGAASGEVTWNKFLVFVTAERRPDPEAWSQRILLSALSPSGRMHTMAGHGPFSGEPCLDPRP